MHVRMSNAALLVVTFIYLAVAVSIAERASMNEHCDGTDGNCCEARCRDGWRGYDGHCYLFWYEGMTMSSGQQYCQGQHANLLEIEDANENNWIKANIAAHPGVCNSLNAVLYSDGGASTCFWRTPSMVNEADANMICSSTGGQVADVPHANVLDFLEIHFPVETANGIRIAVKWEPGYMTQWVNSFGVLQMYLPWDENQPNNQNVNPCVIIQNGLFHNAACGSSTMGPALCSGPPTSDAWIGAVDSVTEDTFQSLMTGGNIPFSDFQDTSGGDTEDCVAYDTSTVGYLWNEFSCAARKIVICEYDADCR